MGSVDAAVPVIAVDYRWSLSVTLLAVESIFLS